MNIEISLERINEGFRERNLDPPLSLGLFGGNDDPPLTGNLMKVFTKKETCEVAAPQGTGGEK